MLYIENFTTYEPTKTLKTKLKEISKALSKKDVELYFFDNLKMHEANLEYRNINKTTDVLSFPVEQFPKSPLGSILINIDLAQDVSTNLNHDINDEISLLFIHGFLHLLGYDHENDDGQMQEEEEKLIKKFNLPDNLIKRNS